YPNYYPGYSYPPYGYPTYSYPPGYAWATDGPIAGLTIIRLRSTARRRRTPTPTSGGAHIRITPGQRRVRAAAFKGKAGVGAADPRTMRKSRMLPVTVPGGGRGPPRSWHEPFVNSPLCLQSQRWWKPGSRPPPG